ncbi:unnamed protein product [Cercopithifilaria johnstoni]|uniref:Chromo domain-containing protein n=1 Tax=Cercopithifilaria johnstoni TaxID=2874296 RepID=A0A8J2M741_9BILA|nr:unnamed protein product [Cercopithifilaria johnstoni]
MEEAFYEPEYIVDMKVTSGRCFYLIKWKDFPMNDCTWEPTENLINCDTLITEYKNSEKRQGTPQEKELKKRGRKKKNQKQSTLSASNPLNSGKRVGDTAFCKELSKERTSDINASKTIDFSTVATLVRREQYMDTIRFEAQLADGNSVWISDRDAHVHLKDHLIKFYERILDLNPLEA